MSRKIRFEEIEFNCPVTEQVEEALIEHTTAFLKSSRSSKAEKIRIPLPSTVKECSGLNECGVKIHEKHGASFQWERCPLQSSLKTGK